VATDPGFAGAPAAGPGLTMTTTEQQGPGLMAAVTEPGDNGPMPLTPAERKQLQRARQKAGETLPCCSSCGARLQPDLRQRLDRQGVGLCWRCWAKSPAGLEDERLRNKRRRQADPERARELRRGSARRFRAKAQEGPGAESAGATDGAAGASQGGEAQG
jgi:hypothetical protein